MVHMHVYILASKSAQLDIVLNFGGMINDATQHSVTPCSGPFVSVSLPCFSLVDNALL
jgi:hypothetical protein